MYSEKIKAAFNKYDSARITEDDFYAITPAQKRKETIAYNKLADAIEAEGLSVNKVVPALIQSKFEEIGVSKTVFFGGWNQ